MNFLKITSDSEKFIQNRSHTDKNVFFSSRNSEKIVNSKGVFFSFEMFISRFMFGFLTFLMPFFI